MKKLLSLLFFFASLGFFAQNKTAVINVNAIEFKKLIEKNNGLLIDLRTTDEIKKEGAIKGAVQIDFLAKDAEEKITNLDHNKNYKEICVQIGASIAKLHNANIIHGDLTTSNMIISKNKLYLIDFGLGFESHKAEDKAVDLHVLKEALEARHVKKSNEFCRIIIENYKKTSKIGRAHV